MIRIATYNVHKCRGLDGRVSADRIAKVINGLDADVVTLQEVLHADYSTPNVDQVRRIASLTGYRWSFGRTRFHQDNPYGNATLSRLPVILERNYDLTWKERERRGCLRTDIELPNGKLLHVFNVHLGTSFSERPHQARQLVEDVLARSTELSGPRMVVGDFNEWTRGLATTLLGSHFHSIERPQMRATYPGIFPLLRLDQFYFDEQLRLQSFSIRRNRETLVASDHLPLIADFRFAEEDLRESA